MADLASELMGALGGAAGSGGLGGLLGGVLGGADDDTKVGRAASSSISAILAGLATNAKTPDGASKLNAALERDHDGSVLDQVDSAVASEQKRADGEKILDHVFGANKNDVAQRISADSGLDLGSVTKLLPALAPMVMGMLGKKKAEGGLDAGALAGMLGGAAGGFDLGKILDVVGGSGSGSSQGGSGLGGVGGILGKLKGLLGGRR